MSVCVFASTCGMREKRWKFFRLLAVVLYFNLILKLSTLCSHYTRLCVASAIKLASRYSWKE